MQVDRLPADMIERIEIIRNPTAEYDAGGIGGIVNIVLKNRADDVTRLRAAWGKNGRLNVGDVVAQHGFSNDQVDVVLAASYTQGAEDVVEDKTTVNASGAVTGTEHKPKPVKKGERLLSPQITWKLGHDKLVLTPFVSSGHENKDEDSVSRDASGVVTKLTTTDEDKTDLIGRFAGRYEGLASWGNWYANGGFQQGREDKDKYSVERNRVGVVTKRTNEDERTREDTRYVGAGVVIPLGDHVVKAGVQGAFTDYDKRKKTLSANNATSPLTPAAPGANDVYQIDETKLAIYLQSEWLVARNHWLTPGIRYEQVKRDATDRAGLTRKADEASPNPSLAYRWAITDTLNLRTSIAQTLRMPKFDDLNPMVTLASGTNSITNPDKGGNPELRPERALGSEIGVEKFFWGNRGVVGINFYHRDVKDVIEKMTRLEGTRYVERPYNAGDARFYGAELDWRVPVVRQGAHQLTLNGNHS